MNERIGMKPPGSLSELQRRISHLAKKRGESVPRVHHRVCSIIFCGLLESARSEGIIPTYVIKGGMAMELRFGMRARASQDLDIGIMGSLDELIPLFHKVLAVGFDGFSFRVNDELLLSQVQTYRAAVRIQYLGHAFGKLQVDLNRADFETSEAEVLDTTLLGDLGLPAPIHVSLLDQSMQIAQKIHGATEASNASYVNRRYRDVIDIFIALEHGRIDPDRLRVICREEFARRNTHAWPPRLSRAIDWQEGLRDEARKAGFPNEDPHYLTTRFEAFIQDIEQG
jgi:hypothetical protein